jgi:hypothetical protein
MFIPPGLGQMLSGLTQGSMQMPGATSVPHPPALPVQLPQLRQLPAFLPSAFGQAPPGAMPMMRERMLSSVLGPLMQPNYGVPVIPPASPATGAGNGGGMPLQPGGLGAGPGMAGASSQLIQNILQQLRGRIPGLPSRGASG